MPELPEVETMRRGILGIVGARIDDVERVACRRRPIAIAPRIDRFRRRAVGRTIRDVGRVGKRVVVQLRLGRRDRARAADDGAGAGGRSAEPRAFAVPLHAFRATASASSCIGTAAGWEVFACFRRKSSKRRSGRRNSAPTRSR